MITAIFGVASFISILTKPKFRSDLFLVVFAIFISCYGIGCTAVVIVELKDEEDLPMLAQYIGIFSWFSYNMAVFIFPVQMIKAAVSVPLIFGELTFV